MARQGPASGGGRVQPGPLSLIVCHGNALLRGLRASRSLGPGKAAPREQGLLGGLCFLHTWLRRGELGDSPPRKLASGDAAPSVEGPPFGELGWRLPCGELAWRPPLPIARDDWRCQTGPAPLKTSSLEAALRRGPACGAVARRARVSPVEGRPGEAEAPSSPREVRAAPGSSTDAPAETGLHGCPSWVKRLVSYPHAGRSLRVASCVLGIRHRVLRPAVSSSRPGGENAFTVRVRETRRHPGSFSVRGGVPGHRQTQRTHRPVCVAPALGTGNARRSREHLQPEGLLRAPRRRTCS